MNDSYFDECDVEWIYNDEYDFGVFIGFLVQGYVGYIGGDFGVFFFLFFDEKKKIGCFFMINIDLNN